MRATHSRLGDNKSRPRTRAEGQREISACRPKSYPLRPHPQRYYLPPQHPLKASATIASAKCAAIAVASKVVEIVLVVSTR